MQYEHHLQREKLNPEFSPANDRSNNAILTNRKVIEAVRQVARQQEHLGRWASDAETQEPGIRVPDVHARAAEPLSG